MTLPTEPTRIHYADGILEVDATVLHVAPLPDGRAAVLLDRTSAHPVDAAWPDQGPDLGVLTHHGAEVPLVDVVVGATDGTTLHLGTDVPVRKGTEGWTFVVAHVVDAAAAPQEGDAVRVRAEAEHRRALSAGHTACHLASLALNAALAPAWRKAPRSDALGRPDFDGTAIASSTIVPDGAVDEYRVGKSVRRAGFDTSALDDLPALQAAIDATLAEWVAARGDIRIEAEGGGLTDRRWWVAALPDGEARIPCGGTHARSTADFAELRVSLERHELDGAIGLTMRTTAVPAARAALRPALWAG